MTTEVGMTTATVDVANTRRSRTANFGEIFTRVCTSDMDKVTSLVIALAGCCVLSVAAASTKGHMYVNNGLYKAFTGNIIFESTAQSQLQCAVQCNKHDSCVTFAFHENTCTGHDAYMSSYSASTPATGAISFTRDSDGACDRTGVKRLKDTSLGLDTDAFCDGNWLVFQRRQNGSVDFYRNWTDYATGFGDVHGEYWLGLETLHCITTRGVTYDLRADLMKLDGTNGSAFYSNFSVGSAADNYPLHYDSFQGGSAADALTVSHDKPFSTWDDDHDELDASNMASIFQTGWWFAMAVVSNLNGHYSINTPNMPDGIVWATFSFYDSLKSCQMMIRPVN